MNEFHTSETTSPLINDHDNALQGEANQRAAVRRSDMLARLREQFMFGV